ncbi:Hypothetical protein R9X50_00771600 [Acrodontium crateriforme]|uniref:SET domain-containing protein n=1 Tax=Acrodontium crateriforme TaxID=150365 RepID=A0AAQ3MAL1_9PEZI|nr:Hypothetical protein R9X50_00771600 [Acrodontium crateriforme]
MYEIRRAGLKGYGVFAKTRIPRGTRIIAEPPSLLVRSERDVFAAGRRLAPEDRERLLRLSGNPAQKASVLSWMEVVWHALTGVDAERARLGTKTSGKKTPFWKSLAEYPTLLNIFRTNNFDLGTGRQATFSQISRFNHSCIPSAQGNFNTALNKFAIHATRTIDAGEEITLSYLAEQLAGRDSRREKLRVAYGFLCECGVCTTESARARASEVRRVALQDKLRIFAEEGAELAGSRLEMEFNLTMDLIALYEAEGLAGRELSTTYLGAAELAVKLNRTDDAEDLARKGLQIEKDCLGSDSPLYHESVARMEKLRSPNY